MKSTRPPTETTRNKDVEKNGIADRKKTPNGHFLLFDVVEKKRDEEGNTDRN